MRELLKYTFVIFILSLKIYSQNDSDSIRKNWKYFHLKTNTKAFVIDHTPAPALCGTFAFSSITIVKTESGETFRVLDLCNSKSYKKNQKIKIMPSDKPPFNVMLPSIITESNEGHILEFGYEKTILETTWAIIKE